MSFFFFTCVLGKFYRYKTVFMCQLEVFTGMILSWIGPLVGSSSRLSYTVSYVADIATVPSRIGKGQYCTVFADSSTSVLSMAHKPLFSRGLFLTLSPNETSTFWAGTRSASTPTIQGCSTRIYRASLLTLPPPTTWARNKSLNWHVGRCRYAMNSRARSIFNVEKSLRERIAE